MFPGSDLPGSRIVQPFRITCETCHSRLKIRTPEVIGEIHACPKCGSMVQIVPPAGWDLNAAPTSDQSSAPGEALSLSTTGSIVFPAGAMEDLSAVTEALGTPAGEVTADVTPTSVLPPAEVGLSAMWWAVGGIASMFLAGGLAWAVWPSGDKAVQPTAPVVAKHEPQPSPEASSESKPATPTAVAVEPDPAPSQTVQAAANQAAKPAGVEPAPTDVKPKEPPAQAAVEAKVESPKPVDPPKAAAVDMKLEKAPSSAPIATATTAAAPRATAVAVAPDHSPVLKFDPLDFDPDRLSANAKVTSDSVASTNSIPDKAAVEPIGNAATTGDVAAPGGDLPTVNQPVANDVARQLASKSVSTRRGPPMDGDPHAAGHTLSARVRSLQVTDMPLVRFVETMSGVASTGITLDPIALEQVGISPQATVSVNMQDSTLKAILHEALAQRRLDIAEQGGQPRVVLPKSDEMHSFDYDVGDLAAGNDAAAVGTLIEHFVSPGSWTSAGGAGTWKVDGTTLHIEQTDAVRREVVIFCERLRLARSLSVRGKYPAVLLSVESPYQRLSAKLGEKVTFTLLPWTRVSDVLRNWQELSGLTVLADWGALAEAELGPSTPVTCSALDRSWQEALDGVLKPLGLTWWAVNSETIQITTPAALERTQRIEFYHVPPKLRYSFATSQALIDSLQKELGEATGKQGKPAQMHFELDEPSGRLIVLASPTVHRRLSHRLGGVPK